MNIWHDIDPAEITPTDFTAVIEIPFLATAFGFTTIGLAEYGISMALAILVIPVVEIVKAIQRAVAKK